MTFNITDVNTQGDYIRITATGEFHLKVRRLDHGAIVNFAMLTLSDDDIQAIQTAIEDDFIWHVVEDKNHHPEGIEVDGVILVAERSYVQRRTGLYRFRDLRTPDGSIECEFATKDEAGNTVWKRCIEGVNFVDIEPFEPVAD